MIFAVFLNMGHFSPNSNDKPVPVMIVHKIDVRVFFQCPDDATADAAVG
jgi:hypothetical protein